MTRAEKYIVLSLLAATALCRPAVSQPSAIQPMHPQTISPGQAKGVPLPHLYYHFLMLQSFLDNKGAALDAQGKNGNFVRADLQKKVGFSDAKYAPIYSSADRLASEVAPLDAQAKAIGESLRSQRQFGIVPSGSPAPDLSQLKALAAERQADIDAEIASLTAALSTKDKEKLDDFLVVFFAPKTLSVHRPAAAGQAGSTTGVQK